MHTECIAQKPISVLKEKIWEEQRRGRQSQKGTQQALGCGHGRRVEEEEEGEVSPVTNNSETEGLLKFNYPQLEMRQNPSPVNA